MGGGGAYAHVCVHEGVNRYPFPRLARPFRPRKPVAKFEGQICVYECFFLQPSVRANLNHHECVVVVVCFAPHIQRVFEDRLHTDVVYKRGVCSNPPSGQW